MMAFILWFAVLVGIIKLTRGWGRALLVTVYLVASILVAL